MKTQHTLSSVQADFAHWRQHKSSSRERIPGSLKQRAVALLKDHSPSRITNTLRISRTQFNSWLSEREVALNDEAIEFITLPSDPVLPETSDISSGVTLNLTQPNGNQWSLCGDLTPTQLTTFVQTLMKA